jgi:hypothetical protein
LRGFNNPGGTFLVGVLRQWTSTAGRGARVTCREEPEGCNEAGGQDGHTSSCTIWWSDWWRATSRAGQKIAKRCHRKGVVAVARKLAVVMHAMWRDATFYADRPHADDVSDAAPTAKSALWDRRVI